MRRRGLRALQPKAFTPRTTDSTHELRCAPNRLPNQLKPTQANQFWVKDITYLPLANGDWAYLCAYQDMVSKQVVGWQVGASMPEELIIKDWRLWSRLKTEVLEGRERPVFADLAKRAGQRGRLF